MQECNSPRNSWRKLIKDDETRGEAGTGLALVLKTKHRIVRFAHALKTQISSAFYEHREAAAWRSHGFFFLLSIVRRKRNDSVPVSTM
jgi:hypothetical protein